MACLSRFKTFSPERVAQIAQKCLHDEINTWPKPGLVSHIDNGSHTDMDAHTFYRSAAAIQPYLALMAQAGYENAGMSTLRQIGIDAEKAMLEATSGINTHRGAIFGLGLLCAATGVRQRNSNNTADMQLGEIVSLCWGPDILNTGKPNATTPSHGEIVRQRYGAGGAREEAFYGFPCAYQIGLPALNEAIQLSPGNHEAIRIQTCFALIARVEDTNLLHRGGKQGLEFAQTHAQNFLNQGGISKPGWVNHAKQIHHEFIKRNLSPGGTADLLSMTLFIHACEHNHHRKQKNSHVI